MRQKRVNLVAFKPASMKKFGSKPLDHALMLAHQIERPRPQRIAAVEVAKALKPSGNTFPVHLNPNLVIVAKHQRLANRAAHQRDDALDAAVDGKMRERRLKARPATGQAHALRADKMTSFVNSSAPSQIVVHDASQSARKPARARRVNATDVAMVRKQFHPRRGRDSPSNPALLVSRVPSRRGGQNHNWVQMRYA